MSVYPDRARPLYLGERDVTFAQFHDVGPASGRATAVLMCTPFGWGDVCSYRARRDWAIQLAQAGYPTLRIDLPGTGDAGGSPRDPARLQAWTDATALAAHWLRLSTGCAQVAAIGIGLGGIVLCCSIAAGAAIDEITLWAVPSRGGRFVHELRAFARLQEWGRAAGAAAAPEIDEALVKSIELDPADASIAAGFILSDETVRLLEGVDLAMLRFPAGRPRRALLLERDGVAVDARLERRLNDSGVEVSVAHGEGYGAMMAEPERARAPTGVFAPIQEWLERGTSAAAQSSSATRAATESVAPGAESDCMVLSTPAGGVRERPLTVDQPFGQLFGILSEPLEGPSELCALLLNAGAIRHIGPNRMWVEIARRWTALGVTTLRLDLEGLGDADGHWSGELAQLYVPELVDQVIAAIDVLEARGSGQRFILAGLCSGAYWSFHGAVRDDRVVAAMLLNPRVLFWDPSLEPARAFRKRLAREAYWHKQQRPRPTLGRVLRAVRQGPRALLGTPRRARGRSGLDDAFDRLRDHRKNVLLAFSGDEPLRGELERRGWLVQTERWPNVTVASIPGSDHILRPLEAQRATHEMLDRALRRELQRMSRPRVHAAGEPG